MCIEHRHCVNRRPRMAPTGTCRGKILRLFAFLEEDGEKLSERGFTRVTGFERVFFSEQKT